MQRRILIVDAQQGVLELLSEILTSAGHSVSSVHESSAALELLERTPHEIVLCDICSPEIKGFELMREITRKHSSTDVLMLTDPAHLDQALEATSLGAADYVMKPLRLKEVRARVDAVLERRRLEAEVHSLQGEIRSRHHLQNIVGNSPRMKVLISSLRRVAEDNEVAVLCGEPGSGRAFLSRALHCSSSRRNEPFAFVSLAGVAVEDMRAALFGRRTAERKRHRGQLELASGGTLVVRDLERMPLEAQEELGRVLARRAYTPVDSDEELKLETRIMLTVSAAPEDLLRSGVLSHGLSQLREAVTIHVPALRDRSEDIPGLIAGFLTNFGEEHGVTLQMSAEAVDRARLASFPGNVAQLFAVLGQCATLSPRGRIEEETLDLTLRQAGLIGTDVWTPMAEHLGDREKLLVMRAVSRNPGRLDQAAKDLGISRTTLWRRMRKYRIRLQPSL